MWHSPHRALGRKRRRVEELSRQTRLIWAIIAGVLLAVWGGAAGFAFWSVRKASASDNLPAIALRAGENFVYDLAKLGSAQTRFFSYPTSSSDRSKLLVQRDSDGVVRAAFASCTNCYSFRGQHYLKEGQFICGQCRTAMRVGDRNERMTPAKGCVAVPVSFSVENNKVIVRPEEIAAGLKNFGTWIPGTAQRQDDSKDTK